MTKKENQKLKKDRIDSYANGFTYYIQDTLYDIASGGRFNFKGAEKYFQKCLIDMLKDQK